MPIEILNTASYAGPIRVWHHRSVEHPSVSIGTGPFVACLRPHEARRLADELIDAANAATRRLAVEEVV